MPFGIHRQDFLFDVSGLGGLLFLELGIKVAFTISENANSKIYVAKNGLHGFLAVSIAAVVGLFVAVVILAAAEFLV